MALSVDEARLTLARAYKGFRTSQSIDEDLKQIKRLNGMFVKLERSEKDLYAAEVICILKTMNNRLDISKIRLLLYEMVDVKFHATVDFVIETIEKEQ